MADEQMVPVELGATGLKHDNRYIYEEFLPRLTGFRQRVNFYREMIDNDPIVGACIAVIKMIVKQAKWKCKAGDQTPQGSFAYDLVDTSFQDMNKSWPQVVSQAMGMAGYGFSLFEILYKKRQGELGEETFSSKHSDGLIGWRDFAVRSQDSVFEWRIDDYGRFQGFVQQSYPDFETVEIPAEKSLIFRVGEEKDSPEGKSAIRNAVRPYWYKKRLEEIEAIGVERDLNGIPVAYVPSRILSSDATAEERNIVSSIRSTLENLRQAKGAGIIWPSDFDQSGNRIYEMELMSSRGRRTHDTNEIINRYNKAIAASMLADFILIGHENVGSFALASAKTHLFSISIGSYLDEIKDVMNKQAIPRLMRLNGISDYPRPTIDYSDIETIDLEKLARYITALSSAGLDLTGDDITDYLGSQIGVDGESVGTTDETDEDGEED